MESLWIESSVEEFDKFRTKGLGSSDIPVVMGRSPWKTRYELWLEKTGTISKKKVNKYITDKGHTHEPKVRSWYNNETSNFVLESRKIKKKMPWARANADGYDEVTKKLIEIKLQGLNPHVETLSLIHI